MVEVRQAVHGDGKILARIDLATWTSATSPVPAPPAEDYEFFDERTSVADVLVAETAGAVVGYVTLRGVVHPPSRAHVVEINGLAVDPARQGEGVARRLVEAAVSEAGHRGARKVSLRVLGPNAGARRLYERCGFVVEGVLREEFVLEGRGVDDIFMARHLGAGARDEWAVSTHDWAHGVDADHLVEARRVSESWAEAMPLHLLLEVLAYADDEAQARGERGLVTVTLEGDRVEVADDGRGTDTRRDELGRVVRKPVMATRDVRFFDAVEPPLLPDGLPRRGMSTVAAVSPLLLHENWRPDGAWSQEYRYGVPQADLREVPPAAGTGTTVSFRLPEGARVDDSALERLTARFRWLTVTVHAGVGERLSAFYRDELPERGGRPLSAEREERRADFVRELDRRAASRVLEVGCGAGRDGEAIHAAGFEYTGVDLSEVGVRLCRELGLRALEADATVLPFETDSFDAAWSMSTLMHLPGSGFRRALDELRRVVRPGGLVEIGVWGHVRDDERPHPGDGRYFRRRTDDGLRADLGKLGVVLGFDTWGWADDGHHYQWARVEVQGPIRRDVSDCSSPVQSVEIPEDPGPRRGE